jgi:hypothetical protein
VLDWRLLILPAAAANIDSVTPFRMRRSRFANYATARFGKNRSQMTAGDVAGQREQTAQ